MADYANPRPARYWTGAGVAAPAQIPVQSRPLSAAYHHSFDHSPGAAAEHHRDPDHLIAALETDPTRPLDDLARLANADGMLVALDVGSGRAEKSRRLLAALADRLGVSRADAVLHVVEPDPAMLDGIPTSPTIIRWAQTFESLIAHLDAGGRLDPPPHYATDFHSVYYRPQRPDGTIPSLGRLPGLLAEGAAGFCAYICEGPGQLQELKRFLARAVGLPNPVGVANVLASLDAAGIPHRPPVEIPNRWPFPMTAPVGEVFGHHFAFLLEGNWSSRPVTARDHRIAGRWCYDTARDNRQTDGDGRGWLDGPDALVLAGERYR